ncbi:LPFR motif small protein [Actinomadura rudentiformis]|nr:LPFR motif small protein [Actinomadura rudentiformis]
MRRISAALQAIISTLVNVITLPFRVLASLLSPSRRRSRRRAA